MNESKLAPELFLMAGRRTHVAGIASDRDIVFDGVATGVRLIIEESDLNDGHKPWGFVSIALLLERDPKREYGLLDCAMLPSILDAEYAEEEFIPAA